jgi:hypothetical protein
MKNRTVILAAALGLVASLGLAQGRGGMAGGQRQAPGRQQPGPSSGRGVMDRQQLEKHATERQRDQYRTYTQSLDQARAQTRAMARNPSGQQFDPGWLRQRMERLHEHLRTMNEERTRLMTGLDAQQRAASREWARKMDRLRERVDAGTRRIDWELAAAMPSRERIMREVRTLDRDMNQWINEHRAMGKELGLAK